MCARNCTAYVPPYGTDGALYVRPVLFGCGEQLGLGPAPEYKFIVAVCPVGNYYAGGLQVRLSPSLHPAHQESRSNPGGLCSKPRAVDAGAGSLTEGGGLRRRPYRGW